jgi:response regulator of citrate/malate metabolism
MIKVGLIEDDIPFAISLKYFFKNFDDIKLCGTAFDLNDSLNLIKNPKYDIILINSTFIEYEKLISILKVEFQNYNSSKIVLLKPFDEDIVKLNNSEITHSITKENFSKIPDLIRAVYYEIYTKN